MFTLFIAIFINMFLFLTYPFNRSILINKYYLKLMFYNHFSVPFFRTKYTPEVRSERHHWSYCYHFILRLKPAVHDACFFARMFAFW